MREMTPSMLGKRLFHQSDDNHNQERWDLTGMEGVLIQFFVDYGGWHLVSGAPNFEDTLRWTPADDYMRTALRFMPGDIAMFVGYDVSQDNYFGYKTWNYRFLWKEILIESGFIALAPDGFLEKPKVELLTPGIEPWDCSKLFEQEKEIRTSDDEW